MINRKLIKIAVVGPESTGKSTLTKQLAQHYSVPYVLEYAREYLENLIRPYTLEDIISISKRQLELEREAILASSRILFCDTNLLVSKIWAENAFKSCPEFIAKNWIAGDYRLHLLMQVDLPWEYDSQREHPHLRKFFFDWYERELKVAKANYAIISGNQEERLLDAIKAVDELLYSGS